MARLQCKRGCDRNLFRVATGTAHDRARGRHHRSALEMARGARSGSCFNHIERVHAGRARRDRVMICGDRRRSAAHRLRDHGAGVAEQQRTDVRCARCIAVGGGAVRIRRRRHRLFTSPIHRSRPPVLPQGEPALRNRIRDRPDKDETRPQSHLTGERILVRAGHRGSGDSEHRRRSSRHGREAGAGDFYAGRRP